MDRSLSGQTSIFDGVFFVFKSLLGIERQKKLKKNHFWLESLGAISEYWYIERGQTQSHVYARHFFVVKYFFLTRLPARITVCTFKFTTARDFNKNYSALWIRTFLKWVMMNKERNKGHLAFMYEKENCALLTRVFVNITTSILYNKQVYLTTGDSTWMSFKCDSDVY